VRIHRLKKLTEELWSNLESVRDYLGEAGHDIIATAEKLQSTLSKVDESEVAVSLSNVVNGRGSSQEQFEYAADKTEAGTLPPLPQIRDGQLERAVFTHPGVATNFTETSSGSLNYDRLEILGDAYIELFATRLIWNRFHNLSSGQISQIREVLVKNETLAEYATMYGFDKRATVPRDHLTQQKRLVKTKGDIFEAYIAAIVLSDPTGDQTAESWLSQLWMPKLAEAAPATRALKSKEALAKKIMGKGVKLEYIDVQAPIQLSGGTQTFFIGVYLTGWGWHSQHLGSGQGQNRTIAGDRAAHSALLNKPLIDEIATVKSAYYNKEKAEKTLINGK
jgi:ribonuclease III